MKLVARQGKLGRWKKIGEGDDGIESDSWSAPVSDFPRILDILGDCESFDMPFPAAGLQQYLRQKGAPVSLGRMDYESLEYFLDDLLGEDFELNQEEEWGGESPGLSGAYVTARIRVGRGREIRRRLSLTDGFLKKWAKDSGLDKRIEDWKENARKKEAEEAASKAAEEGRRQAEQRKNEDQWVENRFREITELLKNGKGLHVLDEYLIDADSKELFVLVLHRSYKRRRDTEKLLTSRLSIVSKVYEVEESSPIGMGWIPHFAGGSRSQEIGWRQEISILHCNDPSALEKAKLKRSLIVRR